MAAAVMLGAGAVARGAALKSCFVGQRITDRGNKAGVVIEAGAEGASRQLAFWATVSDLGVG